MGRIALIFLFLWVAGPAAAAAPDWVARAHCGVDGDCTEDVDAAWPKGAPGLPFAALCIGVEDGAETFRLPCYGVERPGSGRGTVYALRGGGRMEVSAGPGPLRLGGAPAKRVAHAGLDCLEAEALTFCAGGAEALKVAGIAPWWAPSSVLPLAEMAGIYESDPADCARPIEAPGAGHYLEIMEGGVGWVSGPRLRAEQACTVVSEARDARGLRVSARCFGAGGEEPRDRMFYLLRPQWMLMTVDGERTRKWWRCEGG